MKKDRWIKVEVICEVCKTPFLARRTRVRDGLARFCSKECFRLEQIERGKASWGKRELARTYKTGGRYVARWYDENGNVVSEPYSFWAWEMNFGKVPNGMIVLYKDNNPLNINPDNFELGTRSDSLRKANQTRKQDPAYWKAYTDKLKLGKKGFKHTAETRENMSKARKGRKLTEEHCLHIGNASRKMWKEGKFDKIHKGEHNRRWRGGITAIPYPLEFDKDLKNFIKSRDNYQCQICAKRLYKTKHAHVHHIDGDKQNTDQDNLILLCSVCHGKVHAGGVSSPAIMAMHSKLHYQDKDNNQ